MTDPFHHPVPTSPPEARACRRTAVAVAVSRSAISPLPDRAARVARVGPDA